MKSPPELWAELSDPDTLARHLEDFGEIRITRKQPEKIVAWEGERASGTVEIEASGWGTRVILTAEARAAVAAPRPAAPQPALQRTIREPLLPRFAASSPVAERPPAAPPSRPLPAATPAPPVPEAKPEPSVTSIPRVSQASPDPAAAPAKPSEHSAWQRRRSFLSRVFPRRPAPASETQPQPPLTPVPEPDPPLEPAPPPPEPAAPDAPPPQPEPLHPPQPEAPPEPAAIAQVPVTREREPEPPSEPTAAAPEREPSAETLRVLEAVLDDLGAAHHRPFSRG